MSLITAVQFREHFPPLAGTGEDTLLAAFIGRADALMAAWCGMPKTTTGVYTLVSAAYALTFDGPRSRLPGVLCLGVAPLVSVETVTDSGTALTVTTDYTVDLVRGRLGLVDGGALAAWTVGFQAISVGLHAGYATTPPDLVAICAAEVRHLWDLRNTQGQSQLATFGDSATLTDRNALIPEAVQQALAPYRCCS